MRRLRNEARTRQQELRSIYPWLRSIQEGENASIQLLSISVFDHWLTEEEASSLLVNVPTIEQQRRDRLHADFCARIARETEVLSFAFRSRRKDRLVFRSFASGASLSAYFTPYGGRTLGHAAFQVALPELRCAYFESWDDTNHFYFADTARMARVTEWARQADLHMLKPRQAESLLSNQADRE